MNLKGRPAIGAIALHVVIISGACLTVLPLFWMIYSSFKTTNEIFRFPPWLPPETLRFTNYEVLLTEWPFRYWYGNSVVYAVLVTVLVLFFCSLAGFAFAKYTFWGKQVLFLILIGSTMIPFQLILIPLFIVMSRIDWVNTPYAMIVPWVAPAFGIFLMRQYILSVPSELMEAARIDGASEFRIYWQLIIPLIRPALVTLALLTFLTSWNSYIWPLMILRGEQVITLPVGIAGRAPQVAGSEIPYGVIMAAATLVSAPVIFLFVFFQRYFVAGLTLGAVRE